MNTVWLISLLLFLIFINQNNGTRLPRFANYFQDHMVLQRAPQRAIVWGYGESNQSTILKLNNQVYTTVSRKESVVGLNESIWSITLDPVSDEGPFDIHVSQPLSNGTLLTITLHDVLFGDVWICSGQSNMEMAVIDIYNGTEEISNAGNFPKIRLLTVAHLASAMPMEDISRMWLNWSIASPQSVGGPSFMYMSAVCWLYGRMIHQALNARPIGLIGTSWNGTIIELWMPPKALEDCNVSSDKVALKIFDQSSDLILAINNSNLYNAMIYPLTSMVIYGVIWYQGEENSVAKNRDQYSCEFAKMIEYWREIWYQRTNGNTNRIFPFGFVQLSTSTNEEWSVGGFPWIRWHQTFDIGYVPNNLLPQVFMAVALDLRDDPHHTHPRYKHDVGYRLSRSGLAVAYQQNVEYQGPIVSKVDYFTGSESVNITYTNVTNIQLRNPNGFDICCQGNQCLNDTIWRRATIINKNNLTITITIPSSCAGKQLYGIRYLWHETPCLFKQAAIYSSTDPNLPSPPYIHIF